MIRKIGIDDLQIGMYVEKVDRPWLEIPFFKKHIQSSQQIDKLRGFSVRVLYIDTEKGSEVEEPVVAEEPVVPDTAEPVTAAPDNLAPTRKHHASPSIFDGEEVQVCSALQQQAVKCVQEFYSQLETGETPDLEPSEKVVDDLIDNMTRHPGILLTLSNIKSYDEYTFTHSINVALLSITLGKALNYTRSDLKTLGLGALFHDVGKTRVPREIINSPKALPPEDFQVVRKHPIFSVELLKHVPGMTIDIIRVALEHHERTSGSGYPRGLKGASISEFGMISSIADVYDAMTSDRAYRKRVTPHAALSNIYATAKGNFNTGFVERFITRLGIYPVGTPIVLTSGEVGVVSGIHTDKLILPEVYLLFDKDGQEIFPPDRLDLRHDRRNRCIQTVAKPEKFGISVERLLGVDQAAPPPPEPVEV